MNLEELQIKVSIELKDLEKQLKSITKSIDKTLGPKATEKLMKDNHRIIQRESLAINKTLNKAFDVDYKKFNANLNAAMSQAKLTVRSACNDIRRELNSALNVKANIRVIGKTSIDGSATGKSSGSNVASNMASSQYIGAMIIKSTNEVIKVNNANTAKLEQAINGLTSKLTSALNKIQVKVELDASKIKVNVPDVNVNVSGKETKVSNDNSDIVSAITRLGNFNAQGFRGISKSIGQATSKIISAIKSNGSTNNGKIEIEDLESSYLRKAYSKQLGTGSYGNEIVKTSRPLGKAKKIFTGEVVDPETVPTGAFEQLQNIIDDINYKIEDTEVALGGVESKVSSIVKALRSIKGLNSANKGAETLTGEVINPGIIPVEVFEQLQDIITDVNYEIKGTEIILANVESRALSIVKAFRGLTQESNVLSGEVVNPGVVPVEVFEQLQDIITDVNYEIKDTEIILSNVGSKALSVVKAFKGLEAVTKDTETLTGEVVDKQPLAKNESITQKRIIYQVSFKVIDEELLNIVNETIEKIRKSFESVAIETGKVNFSILNMTYPLDGLEDKLLSVINLMKKIHSLRKGLYSDARGFEMGDSPSESHTGKVVNPKRHEFTKAITQKEVIIPTTITVIDDEIKEQVDKAVNSIKQISLPKDVFNFDTDEIITKVRETNEHIKQAFKDAQNLRKQANVPLLEAPIEEAKVDMELFKEIVGQAIGIMRDFKELNDYFHSASPMNLDKAAKDAYKLGEALIDIEEAARKLDGYDLEGLQISDGVTDELKPFVDTLERAWILIGKIANYNPKPKAPESLKGLAIETGDVDDLLNPPKPQRPRALKGVKIETGSIEELTNAETTVERFNKSLEKAEEGIKDIKKRLMDIIQDLRTLGGNGAGTSEDLMLFHMRSAFSASLLPRCKESFSSFSSTIDCALNSRISKRLTSSSIITKTLPIIESGIKC